METSKQPSERCLRIRQTMQAHVQNRLRTALQKLEGRKDDSETRRRRQEEQDKYQLDLILQKGHDVAPHIAIASHISKGTHPDLNVKRVSNLAVKFDALPALGILGSHALHSSQESLLDATNDGAKNKAAYELYLLLSCAFEQQRLGELLSQQDSDAIAAFQLGQESDGFAMQCLSLLEDKCPRPSVHTLSKQIFWLADGNDPSDDGCFEILAPLYPASLVHQAHLQIHERFNEANQIARAAKKERKASSSVLHEYPDLAALKLGGAHPKNVSYLNQVRRGMNYKLSSLPPTWRSNSVHLPVGADSVFDRLFMARPEVRRTVKALRNFLVSKPEANKATRERRESLVDTLLDGLVSMAGEIQQLQAPGWSKDTKRFSKLAMDEQLWLDPLRAELPEEAEFAQRWLQMDWPAAIGKRFAQWLNHQLKDQLTVGDVEAREWAKALLTDEDGFKQQLRELREQLDAPHYIGIRKKAAFSKEVQV